MRPAEVDGEMWCYQKPGFEALLLAELQRQQQCNQFCDTLLKAEGVSVPAHSCILSAISPQMSTSLSSMPAPSAGQRHLLEFGTLGACTLLHMVRLLYSGEMVGEGEREKLEAMSAAAKMGIHGLVEVSTKNCKRRGGEEGGRQAEVGVQTEPTLPEGQCVSWRKEVRDGNILLWKEMQFSGEKDSWTQTEELQIDTDPPSHPTAPFQTIDMASLQSLGQSHSHQPPPQIPCVPISFSYPQDEIQTSSSPAVCIQDSPAVAHPCSSVAPSLLPYHSQASPWPEDPHCWLTDLQEAADQDVGMCDEWEDKRLEQFQDNIPGFISHFLMGDQEDGPRGRRTRKRQRGAGRAGTGERRAKRPQARRGGRGRGGLTQTVDVQDVGASKLQKVILRRCGIQVHRTGQGGGAVGKKLYLMSRELVRSAKSCQRRRANAKVWEFSPRLCRGKITTQDRKQGVLPVGAARRAGPLSAPTPSHTLMSPTAPHTSLLYTTPLPPPAPLPPEEQPEHIDWLLDEVIKGLHILPINRAPYSQGSLPATCSKQQHPTSGSPEIVVEEGTVDRSSSEEPVLQTQVEGELTEILDHFLQSFEQHTSVCAAREEEEEGQGEGGGGTTDSSKHKIQTSDRHTPHSNSFRHTQKVEHLKAEDKTACKTPAPSAVSPKRRGRGPRRRGRKRKNDYLFSLEKQKVRKPASLSKAKTKSRCGKEDKQLRLIPVVKLERSGLLPISVILQGSSNTPGVKGATITKFSSTPSENPVHPSWNKKLYPIRSRIKDTHIMDCLSFLEQPLPDVRRRQPRKNGFLEESSTATPQLQPAQSDDTEESPKERQESESAVLPWEEAKEPERLMKRHAESGDEASDDINAAKRACFGRVVQPPPEREVSSAEAAAEETEEVIDVETVSLTSAGGMIPREADASRQERESLVEEEMDSSNDEIIDVDGVSDSTIVLEDDPQDQAENKHCQNRAPPMMSHVVEAKLPVPALGLMGICDEDIDVIGGSSPIPDPVMIHWTESSESEEEEEIDVIGKADYPSSAILTVIEAKP